MPAVYKLITAIVALIGNLSLITTGELNPLFIFVGSLMFIGYYRAIRNKKQAHPVVIGSLSTVVLLVFFLDSFVLSQDLIVGVAHLSVLFHALKSFDIKDPWDPLQVFFMALIQLLLASELTRSLIFGTIFLLFIITIVFAISLSHLIKEGVASLKEFIKPITVISLICILLTAIVFVSVPRVRGGLWGKGLSRGIKSGFSDTVRLGELEHIKLDPTVVMRVVVTPYTLRPYLRGITFEIYENNTWIDIDTAEEIPEDSEGEFVLSNEPAEVKQEIILEPLESEIIFYSGRPVRVVAETPKIAITDDGTISIPRKKAKRFRYTIYSSNSLLPADGDLQVYLQVPEGLQKVKELARKTTSGASDDLQRAILIEDYLKKNYTYSLKTPPSESRDSAIVDFLFRTRSGYCEYYATAMVLMLRTLNIPARVVSGYLATEFNQYGRYYIVRQRDAHTWVEAAIQGYWRRFDPTPSVSEPEPSMVLLVLDYLKMKWDRYVVGFSRTDQYRILRFFSSSFKEINTDFINLRYLFYLLFFVSLGTITLFILYINPLSRRPQRISRMYLTIKKRLNLEDPSLTATDILLSLPPEFGHLYPEIKEFVSLYHRIRFSGISSAEDFKRYHRLYRHLKKQISA